LEKSWECHRTQGAEAPDAAPVSSVLSVLDPARVEHRTHYTGRRAFPVLASGEAFLNRGYLFESTGRSGCVWWCASGVRAFCNPLCASVR